MNEFELHEHELANKRVASYVLNHQLYEEWWDQAERRHDSIIEYMASEHRMPEDNDSMIPRVMLEQPIWRCAPARLRRDTSHISDPY